MPLNRIKFRSRILAPAEEVFRWHARPGAFQRLTPWWESVEALEHEGIADGARATLITRLGPARVRWELVHSDYVAGSQFRDVQMRGPFASWAHTHRTTSDGLDACFLEDEIDYELPLGRMGSLLGGRFVRKKLERLFRYRHAVTLADLVVHCAHRERTAMKILVSGSTGLVGSQLVPFLTTGGHEVIRLVRPGSTKQSPQGTSAVTWDPASGAIDAQALEGLDAIVHLAGESIAAGRWTTAQKERIRTSRVQGTRLLCETLAKLDRKPRTLVCASAIGYYGNRGDEWLHEESAPGTGFLAEVCREWEAATQPASQAGIRVVNLRFGVILSGGGGALAKMLLPFKLGVGGPVGSGRQWMSWISLDDAVGAIHHALMVESLHGPVNAVSSQPVTNSQFTKMLGRVLKRPTVFPLPAFAARLALGEMADELLLASQRVQATKLQSTGYTFRHAELEAALRHVLGK